MQNPKSNWSIANCHQDFHYDIRQTDIRAMDAYIFWSLLFLPLLHAQIPFSFKSTCFCRFSLYFGGFGNFAIKLSSDPHLKHFRGVRSVCLFSESPSTRVLFFLSDPFETFFCRVISTYTKVHFV